MVLELLKRIGFTIPEDGLSVIEDGKKVPLKIIFSREGMLNFDILTARGTNDLGERGYTVLITNKHMYILDTCILLNLFKQSNRQHMEIREVKNAWLRKVKL